MQRATWKLLLSLAAAAAIAFGAFVLLQAIPPGAHVTNRGAILFHFQLSSTIAMAVFAGVAVVVYVRLSRGE